MNTKKVEHTPGPWRIPDDHLELSELYNCGKIPVEAWNSKSNDCFDFVEYANRMEIKEAMES